MAGILYADGLRLGPIVDQSRYRLPQGHYRLWIRDGKGPGLARAIVVGQELQTIAFDEVLEAALRVMPHHHLACAEACETILGKFAQKIGTTKLTGIRGAAVGDGLYEVITVDWKGMLLQKTLINRHGLTVQLAAPEAVEMAAARPLQSSDGTQFSALWLLPAGGGQFSQGRWGWGIAWATVEAGLLAWNIQAATRYYGAEPGSDARKSAENQAKISGGILYTTIALGIAEAIVTGLLSDSEPE